MTEECVSKNEKKLEAFDLAINMSDRFTILGLDEKEGNFILRDAKYDEDSEMSCVVVPVEDVIKKKLNGVIGVLDGSRPYIVLKGYTRIVGFYSEVHNWNPGKTGELRERIVSRKEGGYGFNGFEADYKHLNEALAVVNNTSV